MPIHPKTLAIYEKAGFPYHVDAEDKAYKEWYSKVCDSTTGEPNQPIQDVVSVIYRIRSRDGKEYIAWNGMKLGIDGLKNPLTFSTAAKGPVLTYIEPTLRQEAFVGKEGSVERRAVEELSRTVKYEKEFSPAAAEELLKKADTYTVSLVAFKDYLPGYGGKHNPVAVENWEDFINGDMDELCRIKTGAYTSNNTNSGNTSIPPPSKLRSK